MSPILILLIGMAVVVGSILLLRLHAFLALIAGALVVAALTPSDNRLRFAARSSALTFTSGPQDRTLIVSSKSPLPAGTPLTLLRHGKLQVRLIVQQQLSADQYLISLPPDVTPAPGDLILEHHSLAAAQKTASQSLGDTVAEGFGKTCLDIGILIAMAAIVGETLLLSGAAQRIVDSARRLLGDRRTPLAFLISGFILGIPVFFDTVFYLLIPLAKVLRVKSGRDYTLYVLSIVAGATMTHSLVPPTPGPLFVAGALNVDLATMILGGLVVGAIASTAGYAYALWANRRWDIPLRPDDPAFTAAPDTSTTTPLPPLWLSLAPILLPVILISAHAFAKPLNITSPTVNKFLATVGDKNISLAIAAAIGLLTLAFRGAGQKQTAKAVGEALASAGVIILVTSAGGAFGYTLRQTDIADALQQHLPVAQHTLIPLAFLAAAVIRTAQGSATVAMITSAGIVSPFALSGNLPFHPLYLALAIGCGSKPVMWMNDSGFWIIGKMSGLTESQTLKTATVMMTIMGVVGLAATMLGAWWFPLK